MSWWKTPQNSRNNFPAVRWKRRVPAHPGWTRRKNAPEAPLQGQTTRRADTIHPGAGKVKVHERCPSLLLRVSSLIEQLKANTHHPCRSLRATVCVQVSNNPRQLQQVRCEVPESAEMWRQGRTEQDGKGKEEEEENHAGVEFKYYNLVPKHKPWKTQDTESGMSRDASGFGSTWRNHEIMLCYDRVRATV